MNRRHAFTLIELLVVISIIAILVALLLPVFLSARNAVRKSVCLSNMRQLGSAISMYSQDNDEMIAPHHGNYKYLVNGQLRSAEWWYSIAPNLKNWKIYTCPSNLTQRLLVPDPAGGPPIRLTYAKRGCFDDVLPGEGSSVFWGGSLAQVQEPTDTIELGEWAGWVTGGDNIHRLCPHWHQGKRWVGYVTPVVHGTGSNYVFYDGHVRFVTYDHTIRPKNLWKLTQKDVAAPLPPVPAWPWPR